MAAQTKAEIQSDLDEANKKIKSMQAFIDDVLDAHSSEGVELVEEIEALEHILGLTVSMVDDLFEAADNSWYVPKSIRNALEPLRKTFIKVDDEQAMYDKFNDLYGGVEDTQPLFTVDD